MSSAILTSNEETASGEFAQLLAAGVNMVDRLATGSGAGKITTSVQLPEVGRFQESWNSTRDLVVDELDYLVQRNTSDEYFEPAKGSWTREVLVDGLEVDRRYGARTATALLLTLWVKLGTWEGSGGVPRQLLTIPADPREWPQVWAANQQYWVGAFTQVIASQPLPASPPAPKPEPLPPPAQPQLPETPIEVASFEDEPVMGTAKGASSDTPFILGSIALLLGGGVVAYTALRKRRG